ncbi:50S ribosomal protein L11 methyltransferase [Thermocrinis minervae]|uniref:[LSU ribosomal protein L11P]-lysine N-methyltransferase n=1 Tax=Thermocrinis minervae TaxID=381751 RepID=A0A1M6RPD3_9AQUI|nr:50S ribosomal protein L11 methyltransferase [Thermocrinis minervae]SHK34326.1 [LSU ribosomal protein L11P]-lysine N-methyltransferase [Thermocrinis minervae]
MKVYKKFVYELPNEDFEKLLYEKNLSLEVISRDQGKVRFAVYQEPLEGLDPVETYEVKSKNSVFLPKKVGSFLIVPSWLKPLILHPGSAFGTGYHPSTQVSLLLLERFLKKGYRVLDVGCGSGILSIAAGKLGASEILGIDIDRVSVKEAKKNARLNGLKISFRVAEPKDIKDQFHLVIANLEFSIFEKVLKDILPLSLRILILAGLYGKDEAKRIISMVEGFKPVKVKSLKGWYGVAFLKKG